MEHYRFSMSLHPIRDSDIIELLQAVNNRQGLIKSAIRKYMVDLSALKTNTDKEE